ncbi:Hachiman antiphage defense system protein HamA [Tropicimonas sp. TH_r6]|uniref:Hachiman antiphage defense system protein HamA n=1 Tax=Tropicimonas sp. TH_r6 TaxID=3082085 RepID=UPI0029533DE5|nr:Hachiman antiphage defense system protein HamA [Tropicimonas sp. TH_r6]MDV7144763.1 Hachiman antiphage defense system protein HamA [Tropicimonas sp. TH_r6]
MTDDGCVHIVVEYLSDELKALLRNRLTEICHGVARARKTSAIYSYKGTLTSFFNRYDTKTVNTKKGMIGELLTHVMFVHYFSAYEPVSPNFNLEEGSIKKGFDLVLMNNESNELWFAEVKSGNATTQTSAQKLGALLSIAKSGLVENLNDTRETLWMNAINGASVAMASGNLKDKIEALLESYAEGAFSKSNRSQDFNALLVAVCYFGGKETALIDDFKSSHSHHLNASEFAKLISLSIQKSTFQAVENFLRHET